MAFQPQTYAEALEKQKSRPVRPRAAPKRRSDKAVRAHKAAEGVRTEKLARSMSRGGFASRSKERIKKRAKRAKLMSRKRAITVLDALTSQIVRLRDGECVLCAARERLQCGHIFGRRSHGARFDITPDGNTHCQCSSCNILHNQRPWVYYKWFIAKFGQDVFDAMYTRWATGHKFSTPELREMIVEYEAKLNSMKAG